jgi:hypothetical protein
MTEEDWLRGRDPDGMLDRVEERFTARRWRLLACAAVRRRWEVIPAGPGRDALAFAEDHADDLPADAVEAWLDRLAAAVGPAADAARAAMLDLVRGADPAAAEQNTPVLTRPNQVAPAFPLFQAASRYAAQAVDASARHVELITDAVRALFGPPGRASVLRAANRAEEAEAARRYANGQANTALKLKHMADEAADRAATAKNKRLEESKAVEAVRKIDEGGGADRAADDDERIDREVRRAVARFLHELAGNPFGDYRFEPGWRTAAVLDLARTIDAERAFDRLPILADALLDADCDAEPVLRHLRGTEAHAKDKPAHARGCWVLDRILRPDDPLFAAAAKPASAKRPRRRGGPS